MGPVEAIVSIGSTVRFAIMDLTLDERPVVRRAVAAYEAKKDYEGPFRVITADEILGAVGL